MNLDIVSAGLLFTLWTCLLPWPERYIKALFFTAPWLGLFVVVFGWQLDAFKAGLLLSPLLLLHGFRKRTVRAVPLTFWLVGAWVLVLFLYQTITREVAAFDRLAYLDFNGRLGTSTMMFLLRLSLVVVVAQRIRDRAAIEPYMNAFVKSVTLLAAYGLVQEVAFVAAGAVLTPIYRDGLFGVLRDHYTLNAFGVEVLRIHSAAREPKDVALFCAPAVVWLWCRMHRAGSTDAGVRRDTIKATILVAASLLTFSSALALLSPLLVVAVKVTDTRRSKGWPFRKIAMVVGFALLIVPSLVMLFEMRVLGRFGDTTDLLQESREKPAVGFLEDHLPRSLVGYGIGTQAFYLPSQMPRAWSLETVKGNAVANVDSFVLSLALDLGLPGVLLLLGFYATVFRLMRRLPGAHSLAATLLACLACGLGLNIEMRSALLWLLTGLALGFVASRRQNSHSFYTEPRSRRVLEPAEQAPALISRQGIGD